YQAANAADLIGRLRDRLAGHPDLRAVAVADRVPFYVGYPDARRVSLAARPCDEAGCPTMHVYAVGASFFDTMGIPIRAGRVLDSRSASDVVVSQHAAATLWPDRP